MTLQEQKNIFLITPKAIKAIAFARQWFNDFTDTKLEPGFLQAFYSNEKYPGLDAYSASIVDTEYNDYGALFWFWFYKRDDRLQAEHDMAIDEKKYLAELADIEASNPLNMISDFFSNIINYLPFMLLAVGGLVLYKFVSPRK